MSLKHERGARQHVVKHVVNLSKFTLGDHRRKKPEEKQPRRQPLGGRRETRDEKLTSTKDKAVQKKATITGEKCWKDVDRGFIDGPMKIGHDA